VSVVVVIVDLVGSLADTSSSTSDVFLILGSSEASKDSAPSIVLDATESISERDKPPSIPSLSSLECGDGILTFDIEFGHFFFSLESSDINKLPGNGILFFLLNETSTSPVKPIAVIETEG